MTFSIEEKRLKRRDYQRQRRKNKEIRVKEREYHKKYYERNDVKDRKKKYNKEYYADKVRGKKHRNYCKSYYVKNKKKLIEKQQGYYKEYHQSYYKNTERGCLDTKRITVKPQLRKKQVVVKKRMM